MKILGIDEAGRGPLIGPLVMAGTLIDEENLSKLKKLKVKDSKMHSRSERDILYDKIITTVEKYEIIVSNPKEIDAALNDPNLNLNWLEAEKMIELINKFNPDRIIGDCPSTNIKKFTEYVYNRINNKKIELVFEHKADENYPIVSAASILAKVTRDNSVDTLKKIYGDFGSGYLTDPKTQKFMKIDHNLPIFRKSWSTWKRLENQKNQRTLGDF
jgi:ribonuclease HII